MKRIAILIGSLSDLPQCLPGLEYIRQHPDLIGLGRLYVASQHRHTLLVQEILKELHQAHEPPDAIIVGAGWANHLTGCVDAFLRYTLKDAFIRVIGVGFEDPNSKTHNQAAVLSMTEVPGTQVIYKDADGVFFGQNGFFRACRFAAESPLPQVQLKDPPPSPVFSLEEALAKISWMTNRI